MGDDHHKQLRVVRRLEEACMDPRNQHWGLGLVILVGLVATPPLVGGSLQDGYAAHKAKQEREGDGAEDSGVLRACERGHGGDVDAPPQHHLSEVVGVPGETP